MTDAIYARISLDDGGALGIARQVTDARKLAERHGYSVPDEAVFSDNDVSAAGRTDKPRPGWDALLERIRAGAVVRVWAYSNSRLTRRPRELEDLIELAQETGVQFRTVASGDDDLTTADGQMVARIKGSVDAAEAARVGERVARQKRQRAERGMPQGGRERLYGYTRDWKVIEEEAAVIRDAFERRARGESLVSIAGDLERRGVTTAEFTCKFHSDRWGDKERPPGVAETRTDCDRCRPGKPWKSGTLLRTLRNPTYAGIRAFKGEEVGRMHEAFPVLVDETTFRAAVAVGESRATPGSNTRKHLLSGIARCAKCGGKMKGATSSRRASRYRCAATYGGCGTNSIRQDWIDEPVQMLAISRHMAQQGRPETPEADPTERDTIREEITAVQAAVRERSITMATALPMLSDLEERLRAAEAALKVAAVAEVGSAWVLGEVADALNAPLSVQRALIARHISAVEVQEAPTRGRNERDLSRVVIHWSDGTSGRLDDLWES